MSLTCFYRNLFSIYVLIMLKPPLMVNNKTREKGRKGENERERERERDGGGQNSSLANSFIGAVYSIMS